MDSIGFIKSTCSWERKVVREDRRFGGEGIGVDLTKIHCIHVCNSQ